MFLVEHQVEFALRPNNTLQPTSLPCVACFNLTPQVVGSAAAERGRWAAMRALCG